MENESPCLFVGGEKDGKLEYVRDENFYYGSVNEYRRSIFLAGNKEIRLFIDVRISDYDAMQLLISKYATGVNPQRRQN